MIGAYIKIHKELDGGISFTTDLGNFNAVKTLRPSESHIICQNQNICNIIAKQNSETYDLNTTYGNENYVIKFWYNNNSISDSIDAIKMIANAVKEGSATELSKDLYPKIYDANNNLVGELEGRSHPGGLSEGFTYVHGKILNNEFDVYRIGHQGETTTYYMYDINNQLVAAIADTIKLNAGNKAGIYNMTIYSNDANWFKIASLYTVCLSSMLEKEGMAHQEAVNGNEKDIDDLNANVYTFQPELLAKENKDFITQIEQSTNPMFLPANMELVKQYGEKTKKDPQNKIPIIGAGFIFGIVILIFILFFIFVK